MDYQPPQPPPAPPGFYVPPPPPPKKDNNGCWKVGAISCIGCGVICVIGLAIMMTSFFSSPAGKKAFSSIAKMTTTQTSLPIVFKGITKYKEDRKAYPATLKDLVPVYINNEAVLHIGNDPSEPLFTYHVPTSDTDQSFVVLEAEFPPVIDSPGQGGTKYQMQLNGKLFQVSSFGKEMYNQKMTIQIR